ncbi:uncharacterized protein DSM5745_10234 [Aspergillus mulundensis]|uniref:Uncharacterized protein n=1 Tax=Aspergillus mulundensis TaxID=1810919 RepID=A0A3D8QMR3_9EURO|nr:hypothetical protein DSM5745_10234 [Aspergillus mulundensis]RDW63123.1 hypothetical protein DSM5745_10234 [Aspergillus mulundensis]
MDTGTDTKRSGALPAADVARVFDNARIPHVLFGWWAVACHGKYHAFPEIDFVLPDDKIEAAANALAATGHFHRCTDLDCVEWTADRRPRDYFQAPRHQPLPITMLGAQMAMNNWHAIAREHLHIGPGYDFFKVISLYAKSHLLWSFPEITLDPIASDDRTYMFTDDVRLPPPRREGEDGSTGPWDGLYPVKIPTYAALIEALLLLYCRDLGSLEHTDQAWASMTNEALGKILIPGTLNLNERISELRRNIDPRWVPILDSSHFNTGPLTKGLLAPIHNYRAVLLASNELPDIPPHDLDGYHM